MKKNKKILSLALLLIAMSVPVSTLFHPTPSQRELGQNYTTKFDPEDDVILQY